jgi:hypothetical protein
MITFKSLLFLTIDKNVFWRLGELSLKKLLSDGAIKMYINIITV